MVDSDLRVFVRVLAPPCVAIRAASAKVTGDLRYCLVGYVNCLGCFRGSDWRQCPIFRAIGQVLLDVSRIIEQVVVSILAMLG